jgi:hypothetical protein
MMPTPMEATAIRSLAAFRPILGNTHDAAIIPAPRFSSVRRSIPFFSPLPIVVPFSQMSAPSTSLRAW